MHPQPYPGPERRTRNRSHGIALRRREKQIVEVERRRPVEGTSEVASALEMHLDQCKTRRAMLSMLESWLGEARNAPPDAQDPVYVRALERSLEVFKETPDIETAIAVLQRRTA